MKARCVGVCAALIALAACSGGGGGSGQVTPSALWGRERGDNLNSGSGSSLADNDGATVRSFDVGVPLHTTPAVGPSGVVYVGTDGGRVVAVNTDMTLKWEYVDTQLGAIRSSFAADQNERIYFGTENGWIVCLDGSGAKVWQVNVGGAVRTSPVVEFDVIDQAVTAVFAGTATGRFVALGGADGSLRWQYPSGEALGAITASPVFDSFTMSVVSSDALLYSLRRDGSSLYAPFDLGGTAVPPAATPTLAGTSLVQPLINTDGSALVTAVTVGEQSRTTRWRFTPANPVWGGAAQISRSIEKKTTDTDGKTTNSTVVVREVVLVDEAGLLYVLDEQIGAPGTRCIGGKDDAAPCHSAADCRSDDGEATCEPLSRCAGGTKAGVVCRSDETDDCPEGTCEALGTPALFSINSPVMAAPTVGADTTVLVPTAPGGGASGVLYAVGIPTATAPSASKCPSEPAPPPGCRWTVTTGGAIEAAAAIGKDSVVYFGSTDGRLYSVSKGAS